MRTRRRLALVVLLAAAGLAVAAFPVRATWWGGWILAVAEAGIVGGLADWFAVTALFRRPLGLPIPHTALIPANWELMAERVGTMVGDRVLTCEYLTHEIGRLDVADLLARAAERFKRSDLEAATRAVLRWVARELSPATAAELTTRLERLLAEVPVAPLVGAAVRSARQHGWDQRIIGGVARALVETLDRPEVRHAVGDVVEEVLARYRERLGFYPRLAIGFAHAFGLIDRERIVAALSAGLADVARDPGHPLRVQLSEALAELAGGLEADPEIVARVEAIKREVLTSPLVARLVEEAASALREALLADVVRADSEVVAWLADRLEWSRRALAEDAAMRQQVDHWIKARAVELVERYHGGIATFIEKGVHALGPEGAVQLIEEHAGDDLQYIRVNGTVVGGLAGGALYAIHLLLQLF